MIPRFPYNEHYPDRERDDQRYGWCDEIASMVDMSKLTIEGGEEMTTNNVVERLNQLEEVKEAAKDLLHAYDNVSQYVPEGMEILRTLLKEQDDV